MLRLPTRGRCFLGNVYAAKNSDFIQKKKEFETSFNQWVAADPSRKAKYGTLITDMKKVIESDPESDKVMTYLNFSLFGSQMIGYAVKYYQIGMVLGDAAEANEQAKAMLEKNKASLDKDFKNFNPVVDKAVFIAMLNLYMKDIPQANWPDVLTTGDYANVKPKKGQDKIQAYADMVYSKSIFTDKARMKAWLDKPSGKTLQADPGYKYLNSVIALYIANSGKSEAADESYDELMTTYMAAMREFKKDEMFYPDANSTLRLTYGSVLPYDGRDGISYHYYTTSKGILEKEAPATWSLTCPKNCTTSS